MRVYRKTHLRKHTHTHTLRFQKHTRIKKNTYINIIYTYIRNQHTLHDFATTKYHKKGNISNSLKQSQTQLRFNEIWYGWIIDLT